MEKFLKDEVVFRENDPPDTVYFVLQGEINYINEEGDTLVLIKQGEVCGEAEVIQSTLQTKRKCFAVAITNSLLLICDSQNFRRVLNNFPAVKRELFLQGKKRLKEEEIVVEARKGTRKQGRMMYDLIQQKIKFEKYNPLLTPEIKKKQFQLDPSKIIMRSREHYELFLKSLRPVEESLKQQAKKKMMLSNARTHYPQSQYGKLQ